MKWLLKGFHLLHQPGIKRYAYAPILVNIVVFCAIYIVAGCYWHDLVTWITQALPHWLAWLGWLLWIVFALLAILILAFCFGALAMVLGAPFYGMLSAKVQQQLNGPKIPDSAWHEAITGMPSMCWRQLKILLAYCIPAFILLLFSWIAFVHIVAMVLWFLLGARLQTMQNLDLVFQNNLKSYQEAKQFYREHRPQALLFGMSIMLLLMVPILNWFVLPAAAAGGTAWYCNQMKVE